MGVGIVDCTDYVRLGDYLYTLEHTQGGIHARLYDGCMTGYPLIWQDVQGSEDEAVRAIQAYLMRNK